MKKYIVFVSIFTSITNFQACFAMSGGVKLPVLKGVQRTVTRTESRISRTSTPAFVGEAKELLPILPILTLEQIAEKLHEKFDKVPKRVYRVGHGRPEPVVTINTKALISYITHAYNAIGSARNRQILLRSIDATLESSDNNYDCYTVILSKVVKYALARSKDRHDSAVALALHRE